MRDGYVVKDVPSKETDVADITKWMVGRNIASAAKVDIKINPNAKNIMSIRNLWVDMPGETVRNVTLDIKEGEILGIGGLAGQGKLGIPQRRYGALRCGWHRGIRRPEHPVKQPEKMSGFLPGLCVGGQKRRRPAAGRDAGVERGVHGYADSGQIPEKISGRPGELER